MAGDIVVLSMYSMNDLAALMSAAGVEISWKAAQEDLFHIEYKPLTEEMQKGCGQIRRKIGNES